MEESKSLFVRPTWIGPSQLVSDWAHHAPTSGAQHEETRPAAPSAEAAGDQNR